MSVFETPEFDNHEEVVFVTDTSVGLKAIIAVHNTNLGPGLGGVRMWPYASDDEALRDVLRLSRGMTYKAATLGVKLGGGKSVIIGDARTEKTPQLLESMGRAIERLSGRYIAGEDIGTNPQDMKVLRGATSYVTCLLKEDGGYGDPAKFTALGVVSAMKAGLKHKLGRVDFEGVHVAVQGVGNVGRNVCRQLSDGGAKLTITDAYPEVAKRVANEVGAIVVSLDEIYEVEADIFAPCAVGAVLDDETIPRLRAKVVAGAANNQLAEEINGEQLAARGIAYMPDYVANGGGLIACYAELNRQSLDDVPEKVRNIYDTCIQILEQAESEGITTSMAANRIAESRFLNRANGRATAPE